jgi:branched-chain amino acid transport system substrate-binding protein
MAALERVLRVALTLVLLAVPAPCPAALDKGAIRIGLVTPVTGPYAPLGLDVDNGFRYYLATHGGRLGGFRAVLKDADEGNSLATALENTRELVEQGGVDAIVGVVNSSVAYGMRGYLTARREPLIIATAGADDLTQGDANDNVFRVADTNSQATMPLGDFACRRLHMRTVAMIAVDYPLGWEAAGGFARTYTQAGCRIVEEAYVPAQTGDWRPFLRNAGHGAAAVFAAIDGPDAVRFLSAYREAGPKLPLFAWGGLTDERILGAEGRLAAGVVTGLHYAATLPGSRNTRFRRGYEALTGHPVSQIVENGYVAAAVLDEALSRIPASGLTSSTLAHALRAVHLDAPRGPVSFDAFRQAIDNLYVRRVSIVGGKARNEVIATYPGVSQFWRYPAARYLAWPRYAKLKGTWVRP